MTVRATDGRLELSTVRWGVLLAFVACLNFAIYAGIVTLGAQWEGSTHFGSPYAHFMSLPGFLVTVMTLPLGVSTYRRRVVFHMDRRVVRFEETSLLRTEVREISFNECRDVEWDEGGDWLMRQDIFALWLKEGEMIPLTRVNARKDRKWRVAWEWLVLNWAPEME